MAVRLWANDGVAAIRASKLTSPAYCIAAIIFTCVFERPCGALRLRTRAFSGKVDFRFSEENATTQGNLERVSARDRVNANGTRSSRTWSWMMWTDCEV